MKEEEFKKSVKKEIHKNRNEVEADPHRQSYHLMAPVGLMGEPAGLVEWDGEYHLFFQWNPFDTGHSMKIRGHYRTVDFLHYTLEEPALVPGEWYDAEGCSAGSAVIKDGVLHLFYTGYAKDKDGQIREYPAVAVSENGHSFEKQEVLLDLPENVTSSFRSPNVWREGDQWFMAAGSQTEGDRGVILLYTSPDLKEWEVVKRLAEAGNQEGEMWENPDYFTLDGEDILFFSARGLTSEDIHFRNASQAGYISGVTEGKRWRKEDFRELDRGFEFYAPQTFETGGRRLMIAWMGVPGQYEESHPTVNSGWTHTWTIPRELSWDGDKIIQRPFPEARQWRKSREPVEKKAEITNDQQELEGVNGRAAELEIEFESLEDMWAVELFREASFSYKKSENLLTLSRPHPEEPEKTEFRHVQLDGPLRNLHLFIDRSSLEIFVNGGEEVFTSRIFADAALSDLAFTSLGTSTFGVKMWELAPVEITSYV
ncbi:glycoside hydrolase family 32 protein [Salimicrobium salexigens]|uniref:Sucrose-6-phosphate hydrolase n=1 Tax=Salimicrobium salexigens TaxID=908941 RepID=A0ABY1KUI1_9BACI|nr:sucrose-6-phosphate hydrolase [Salimicrobium salexigens]SIS80850.1 beta-fructofuranosidase [Salimicrobium salexigens]